MQAREVALVLTLLAVALRETGASSSTESGRYMAEVRQRTHELHRQAPRASSLLQQGRRKTTAEKSSAKERMRSVADLFPSVKSVEVYRIPALLALDSQFSDTEKVADHQVVLAFAERRKNNGGDDGDIDTVLRRSEDGGKSWAELVTICDAGPDVCGNPSPVEDSSGGVHVLMTQNPAGSGEWSGHIHRTVWVTQSQDQGRTWGSPREITAATKPSAWAWYATGPGHGIRLQHQSSKRGYLNGRLMVPSDHGVIRDGELHYNSHVLFSDDDGETWQVGGNVPTESKEDGNEASLLEKSDGELLLNARNFLQHDRGLHRRLFSESSDGGLTWNEAKRESQLNEPDCQGSMVKMSSVSDPDGTFTSALEVASDTTLLFSHPATKDRRNLQISVSTDNGRSWPPERTVVLHEGSAGYSDLQILRDGKLVVLFEKGHDGIAVGHVDPRSLLQ